MKNNKLGSLFWILLVVCILNIVGHLAVYPALPDTVPIHWGASGEVNGWSSKQSNLIFCVLPLAMLVFMEVVRRIDPKHQNFERFGKVWNIFITLMVLLTAGMTWLTELTVFNMLPQSSNIISLLVCGGVGVMFIILGNFMPNIKQNYTFGCRTPWALNDEHNWQRTQRDGHYADRGGLFGRPAGRYRHADPAAVRRVWRLGVDLSVFLSCVCWQDEVKTAPCIPAARPKKTKSPMSAP